MTGHITKTSSAAFYLPSCVRNISSLDSFRKAVKTYLIKKAF